MKITLCLFLLLLLLAACGRSDDVGGRLPMVVTQWDEENEILRWFNYGDYGEYIQNPVAGNFTGLARIGDDFPVPRAMVAKMLSLAAADLHTTQAWARYPAISFLDVNPEHWYFEYINAVYVLGQMSGYNNNFRPRDMLTLHEAGLLMAALNPGGPGLQITDDNRNLPISYALWVDLFNRYLTDTGSTGVLETLEIIPLIHDNTAERVTTNLGSFSSTGINMEFYLDTEIKVLHRDGEIVAMLGQTANQPILRNAFILEADDIGLTILLGGATRQYIFGDGVEPLPLGTLIADIQISGTYIIGITPSDTVIRGTLEQVGPRRIVLREWGALPLRAPFAVYSIMNGMRTAADLIVGANIADFHMTDGAIGAAVITDTAAPENIRVVIGTSNFAGLVHENVAITATGRFTVNGPGVDKALAAGEVFTVSDALLTNGDRLYIQPVNPEHRLEIIGLVRNQANPTYRGKMEISRADGGFIVINELPLEEYLYAVVPSEMPSYYGIEAAKVQAITARTFAIHQFYENRFRAFGAHVDDSVISQVYNNIPENDISREAVRATAGLVLTVNGEVIRANYFSTSAGVTANFGEVWAGGGQFPAATPPHLTSQLQFEPDDIPDRALRNAVEDLSREENADLFFRSQDIPAFERELPWFRWYVRMTSEELSNSINNAIGPRHQANPAMIHALDNNHLAIGAVPGNIGQLTALEVTRRGQGGNVMEMILTGTAGTVRVQTEFNIRSLLAPRFATVTRVNGSDVTGMSLMPSGFFSIEKETDPAGNLVAVTFHGGGHGHGVGMSQNGAHALLQLGYTYREVLMHYYPGIEITYYAAALE
ncbi:MAG: SpoIID/LytB domain-containing protein [Defluviitaleaceae bacterium]|nr:SpoIID/LytB domain-containing protein [Defluviitaleaceae bacterium]